MKSVPLDISRSIIAGLNYLVLEAENGDAPQIARLLTLCLRDICVLVEDHAVEDNLQPVAATTDLFMAIRFLSRYASIEDKQLRQEILDELEKLEGPAPRLRRADA